MFVHLNVKCYVLIKPNRLEMASKYLTKYHTPERYFVSGLSYIIKTVYLYFSTTLRYVYNQFHLTYEQNYLCVKSVK